MSFQREVEITNDNINELCEKKEKLNFYYKIINRTKY